MPRTNWISSFKKFDIGQLYGYAQFLQETSFFEKDIKSKRYSTIWSETSRKKPLIKEWL